jgi:hypothetical protein
MIDYATIEAKAKKVAETITPLLNQRITTIRRLNALMKHPDNESMGAVEVEARLLKHLDDEIWEKINHDAV